MACRRRLVAGTFPDLKFQLVAFPQLSAVCKPFLWFLLVLSVGEWQRKQRTKGPAPLLETQRQSDSHTALRSQRQRWLIGTNVGCERFPGVLWVNCCGVPSDIHPAIHNIKRTPHKQPCLTCPHMQHKNLGISVAHRVLLKCTCELSHDLSGEQCMK